LILGFVIVSYIALRPFPSRVRYLFDFVCFVGATFILLRHQTLPLPGNGEAANASSLWLHAVARYALQNTLADVFAGIAFGIEAPFNVGDRISLGDKIEGTVVQMNWRSIRILTCSPTLADVALPQRGDCWRWINR